MTGSTRFVLSRAALVWVSVVLVRGVSVEAQYAPKPPAGVPTYTKDVAPILYKNCTQCHRSGRDRPDVAADLQGRPALGEIDPRRGQRRDHAAVARGCAARDVSQRPQPDHRRKGRITKWANGGAPEGDPKDLPAAPVYADGWALGKPDAVFEMEEAYKLPADGTIQYEYFYIPTNFTEPKWVKSIEIRPSNRQVVHHVLVYYRATPDLQRTPVFRPNAALARTPPEPKDKEGISLNKPRLQGLPPRRMLATYAPGTSYQIAPEGTAFRLEPGGIIELQMHYTTKGEAATDRTKVGFIFAKGEAKELRPSQFFNGSFTLPAGDANVEVPMDAEFLQDATVWGSSRTRICAARNGITS